VSREARAGAAKPRPARKCPICGEPATAEFHPFCSRKCTNIDLNRWLSGRYVIPAAEETPSRERNDED
jgi:endogenous inhibitor of DNA gyrase (YacG/DUF329 family)